MKLRQTRSRQTRDQILAAARELFARQGFDETSIEQIASAAKVAKSSVFVHFGDKANLLAALGLTDIEKLAEAGRNLGERKTDQPVESEILALLRPWLDYFCREPAFAGLYLSQSAIARGPHTDAFMRLCLELEDQVADVFSRRAETATADRARLLARGVQALFHEVIVFQISGWLRDAETGLPSPPEEQLAEMLKIWVAGAASAVASKT